MSTPDSTNQDKATADPSKVDTSATSSTTTPAKPVVPPSEQGAGPDQGLTVSQDTFDNPDARVPDQIPLSMGADGIARVTGTAPTDGWEPAPVHASDEEIAAAEARNKADDERLAKLQAGETTNTP